MCGRYASIASTDDLVDELHVDEMLEEDLGPSWNIAPTDPIRAVLDRRGTDVAAPTMRQLRTVRWGLVPSWANDRSGAARMINARVETVADKPAFRAAVARRRCLVPADGYYEWRKIDGRSVPYFLHDPDGGLLTFAGLYEVWTDPSALGGERLWTCTIITRAASDRLGHIHDRSPVVVPPRLRAGWLDCADGDTDRARHLLDAVPQPQLAPRVVSTAVNSCRNDGPELIQSAVEPPTQESFDLGL